MQSHLAVFRVGVPANANTAAIAAVAAKIDGLKRMYHELSLRVHPDKSGPADAAVATEAFKALQNAYEDLQKRQKAS